MPVKKPGEVSTRVMYVGIPRYQALCRHAREISMLAESNIKPSQFLQFMIDEFSDQARAAMLMLLRGETPEKKD